jgi:hypothetical protein
VRDDGPGDGGAPLGASPAAPAADLVSTRIRLRQMYGPEHRLEVSDLPGGGVRVAVEIPWRADPAEPAAEPPPLAASLVPGGRTG